MSLIDLQRDMRAWLEAEDAHAAARYGVAAASGLAVYQNNYRAQLVACLEESFERTRQWIGGEAFHRAVVTHVERLPPSSWTLDAYPRDFPSTLALLYPADAEVVELAWLEMALGEAFVALDAKALHAEDVGGVNWDRAVLHVAPTLDIADLTTNAPAIWSALVAEEKPPPAAFLFEPGALLVWRSEEMPLFRTTDQLERQSLLSARAGIPFNLLCESIVEELGEDVGIARVGAMLGQWLADGLIVGISE